MLKFPNLLIFVQKLPTPTPFFAEKHNSLTISLLHHQRCQKPLGATSKPSRRQGEGRTKGERRISVIALNVKHINATPSLCIIRNKNPKTLHFPHNQLCQSLKLWQSLATHFPHFLILKFPNLLIPY